MAELLVFLVLILVAVVVIFSVLQGKSNWSSAYEQLALRYGGWFTPVRLLRLPAASFRYKESECRVRCMRRLLGRPKKSTELRIGWPLRGVRLEIREKDRAPRIRSSGRLFNVETADAGFSDKFACVTNNPNLAGKLLSPAVGWQISQLQSMAANADLRIVIARGWMTVGRIGYIRHAEPLDDFVRYSLELFDQMMLTMSEGIEFHDNIIPAVETLQCPVCSSDIESQMVICVRCKTPHCHDCWLYNGKCGMYACNETRFSMTGGPSAGR